MRGADKAVCGAAHLTLPGAIAPGPLPLPPEGRRGALVPNAEPTDTRRIWQSKRTAFLPSLTPRLILPADLITD